MADTKLSDLPALSSMTATAVVPVVESGITKIITGTTLRTFTRTTDVDASELLGTTLPASVVNSSLTSLGTIADLNATDLTVTNPITRVVPMFSRRHSVAQNLVSTVNTRVLFNTVEDSVGTTGVTYDTSLNPGRFINNSGSTRVYNVSVTIEYSSASTAGHRMVWIQKGANRIAQQSVNASTQNSGTQNETTVLNVSTPVVLQDGEYFEVWAYQDSGSSVPMGSGGDFSGSYISLVWI